MSKINKIKVENTTYDIQDNTSGFITKDVNNLTNYELKTATGNSIEMSINSSTYVMTLSLKNSQGTILNTQTVDLPLETMVVGGTYDSTNKKIVLTLKNGNTIDVPVGDLINGLQSEITSTNKLDASLVDDSLSNNKFVTTSEKTTWNNKSDFSGDYNDLSNKPTIPDVSTKEDTSNKVTTIDNTSTDMQYASAKAIYDLVSGISGGTEINVVDWNYAYPFVATNLKKGVYIPNPLGLFYYKVNSTKQQISGAYPIMFIFDKDYEGPSTYGKCIYYNSNGETYIANVMVGSDGSITLNNAGKSNFGASFILNQNAQAQTLNGIYKYKYIPQYLTAMTPTNNNDLTNKKYVDDSISSAITTTLNGSY